MVISSLRKLILPILSIVVLLGVLDKIHISSAQERAMGRPQTAQLQITEIMYNPTALGDRVRSEFEFIELKNNGSTSIDLSGMKFASGLDFVFPAGTLLHSGELIVLAKSRAGFVERYKKQPFGEYDGKLKNGGEILTLQDRFGATILTAQYADSPQWPTAANGCGFSLVPQEGASDFVAPTDAAYWRRSTALDGSPGVDDPSLPTGIPFIRINEVLAHTDLPQTDAVELYNPTSNDIDVTGWFLSDDSKQPDKMILPTCSVLPAQGYLVLFTEEYGLALSAWGDELSLYATDPAGNLIGYEHAIIFGATQNGLSVGRTLTSTGDEHFAHQITTTLGTQNRGPLVGPVVISELMYNPKEGDEYIRLQNVADERVFFYDLDHPDNRWRLQGVGDYMFPPNLQLFPGTTLLVVPIAPEEFRQLYEISGDTQIIGPYSGKLADEGERIALLRPDTQNSDGSVPYIVVDEVEYDDKAPWPTAPDGEGAALRRTHLQQYGNDAANWRSSNDNSIGWIFLPLVVMQ
ncbi:lamin tail domain-containing protein [Chloroflexi bacterium TSY]|nr:lamin tail domain-containing protein [Chloroflexi bacterium TSY]